MNLSLFYVWEEAKVWTYWNYSSDTHLNYLGPVACLPLPWNHSVFTLRVPTVAAGLMALLLFVDMASNIFHSQFKCITYLIYSTTLLFIFQMRKLSFNKVKYTTKIIFWSLKLTAQWSCQAFTTPSTVLHFTIISVEQSTIMCFLIRG